MRPILLTVSAAALAATALLPASAAPQYGTYGFDSSGQDKSVAPGDDFYAFANGNWVKNTPIPDDKSRTGMIPELADLSRERTRTLIEEAAKAQAPAGSDTRRIGDFYTAFMDEAAIEKAGTAPLAPTLQRIDAIATPAALARALGDASRAGIGIPFGLYVGQDEKAPDHYAAILTQSGLGLPDRDYYLLDKPDFADARAKYTAHVAAMLKLAGRDAPEARAKAVFALEHGLAAAQWSKVALRDPIKTYNPRTPETLAAEAPGLDWPAFLAEAGVGAEKKLIVGQPSAVAGMAKLVAGTPIAVWRDYLLMRTLDARASVLPAAFVAEDFAFNGTVLAGTPKQRERWKRGVDATNEAMGEAVGKLYVAHWFTPDAKAKADALVHNLLTAMGHRIDALDWMSPATKKEAHAKLATFVPKIGYPDHWRDYSRLVVRPDDAFGNKDRAARFEVDRQLAHLGQPVDRSEWFMTPMTVNAYYNPPMNEIVFPAAILQPPFFDPDADPAVNYGGAGAVIGHEISHGFDDQGRQYDAKGALRDWWAKADAKAFVARANKLIQQYDAYEPLPGTHINGALTLGENLADLAGLKIAYEAYHLSLGGKPAPILDGTTGDQRFFLSFAQIWRSKYRDKFLLKALTTDPHSPPAARVSTVRNLDSWYDAFKPKPGTKLYLAPKDRVRVW